MKWFRIKRKDLMTVALIGSAFGAIIELIERGAPWYTPMLLGLVASWVVHELQRPGVEKHELTSLEAEGNDPHLERPI